MSLDVWLKQPGAQRDTSERIYVREDGQTREITRAEWDARFPDREPFTVSPLEDSDEVYSANITHNLNKMADEAGIYKALWRPEEIGIERAEQLISPLRDGLALLNSKPERFKEFNPPNGWGDYGGLCRFVADYLAACERYPNATVHVSR